MMKLKKCKFCGSKHDQEEMAGPQLMSSTVHFSLEKDDCYDVGWSIICGSCGLEVHDEYADDLVAKWNRK
jgi:hypothetical protein